MLKSLTIENYALIDSLSVEWDEHLNIITGETGAGKSILLGALGLLLGAKNEVLKLSSHESFGVLCKSEPKASRANGRPPVSLTAFSE